jgi:hypothetical protein
VLPTSLSQSLGVVRAMVVAVNTGRSVVVALPDGRQLQCLLLTTVDGARLTLAVGDEVLVLYGEDSDWGILMGRIDGRMGYSEDNAEREIPDEVVLEARESLTLRVGDGSITIRADGKILIKGKDLVSHAQRTNRIKGGSVAIN